VGGQPPATLLDEPGSITDLRRAARAARGSYAT